jgi:hypothetical protein
MAASMSSMGTIAATAKRLGYGAKISVAHSL